MKCNESSLQVRFTSWLKKGGLEHMSTKGVGCAAYELKFVRAKPSGGYGRIRIGDVREHQVEALRRAKHGNRVLVHKISDSGIGLKPFDCFYMKGGCDGKLIIGFEVKGERVDAEVYMVDIDEWLLKSEEMEWKGSVTVEWVREKGVRIME